MPPWPVAGPEVADELEALDPATIPATIEWLGRLEKLQGQMEAGR